MKTWIVAVAVACLVTLPIGLLSQTVRAATFSVILSPMDPTMGLLMQGRIVEGDDARFAQAITAALHNYGDHRLRALGLSSPGGLVVEALKMADRIRTLGLATVVPDGAMCASACALLFAAGSLKIASPEGLVGVHGAATGEGEQDLAALAATTYLAKAFAALGAPASVIGRMVVTAPTDIIWLSPQEISMFPLGFSMQISMQTFPLAMSGFDGYLNAERKAGREPKSLPFLSSTSRPDYQQAGRALPQTVPPNPNQSPAPIHSKEVLFQAQQFSRGYFQAVTYANVVCEGELNWVRGCNGGNSFRAAPYWDPKAKQDPLARDIKDWLDGYDSAIQKRYNEGSCGNGGGPGNDGCRVGGRSWVRRETNK